MMNKLARVARLGGLLVRPSAPLRSRMFARFSVGPSGKGPTGESDSPFAFAINSIKPLLGQNLDKDDPTMMNMVEALSRITENGIPDNFTLSEADAGTILDFLTKTVKVNPEFVVPKGIFVLMNFAGHPRFLQVLHLMGDQYLPTVVTANRVASRIELRTLMQIAALLHREGHGQDPLLTKCLEVVLGNFKAQYPKLNYQERVYLLLMLQESSNPEWKALVSAVEADVVANLIELDFDSLDVLEKVLKGGLQLTEEKQRFLEEVTLKLIHGTFNIPQVWRLMAVGGLTDEFWEGMTPVIVNTLPYTTPQAKMQLFVRMALLGKQKLPIAMQVMKALDIEVGKLSQADKLRLFNVLGQTHTALQHTNLDELFEEVTSGEFGREVSAADWREAMGLYQQASGAFPEAQLQKLKQKAQAFMGK